MRKSNVKFAELVYEVVAAIPAGKVMTYGQIAALCGQPRAARIVGGIAHWGDPSLPWQRVIKKDGSLAEGFPGGIVGHADTLRREGVEIGTNFKVKIENYLWNPDRS